MSNSFASQGKVILFLSLPLASFVMLVSITGIFTPDFYSKESLNWQAQSVGQDIVDLFLVTPVLLITAILAYRKSRIATSLWGGTVLYVLYTFVIYSFDIHFNRLFIIYCLALGLSFYSVLYLLYTLIREPLAQKPGKSFFTRAIGIYFLLIPVIFYFLWLSEIVPAIVSNTIPKSLTDVGLFTNPVHILDLSVFLPGIFMTGLLILKKSSLGLLLAPVMLSFFILMDITIGALIIVMKHRGVEAGIAITIMMSILALFSLAMLAGYFMNAKKSKTSNQIHILK